MVDYKSKGICDIFENIYYNVFTLVFIFMTKIVYNMTDIYIRTQKSIGLVELFTHEIFLKI